MAGVDYCTVLPSWEFDKDPACVVSYLFDSIDGSLETSGTDYIPPNNFMDSCLTLECASNDQLTGDSREPCTLSITSKPQYRVSVLGVDIISQSRSLEVYDTCEGYMTTSRGKRMPCLDAEGGENQSDMFSCRVRLRETLFGFTLKFPSTSNMKRFNIYNIVLILNPEAEDVDNVEVSSSFNMDKVKSFVDTDTMSPAAQQLMRSVEQFQLNKKSAVSGLQGMLGQTSQASAGSPRPGMMELMGLMSMFSNMSTTTQSGSQGIQRDTTQSGQLGFRDTPLVGNHSDSRNISEAGTSRLGFRNNNDDLNKPLVTNDKTETHHQTDSTSANQANMFAIPSLNVSGSRDSAVGSFPENSNDRVEEGDMYQMLKNICGKVSQTRTVHLDGNNETPESRTDQSLLNNSQSRSEEDTGEAGQRSQNDDTGGQKFTPDTLRTVVKSCMGEFELRLQTHLDERLSQIEQKLNDKLDKIMEVIQTATIGSSSSPPQTPICNHTNTITNTKEAKHNSQQGASHIPREKASHVFTESNKSMHAEETAQKPSKDNTNLYTQVHTNMPSEEANEQSLNMQTDSSDCRYHPNNSPVMNDENGENS
ncbi:uncharacterized protein LOC132556509 [Ylistrum balloti]|uniref:uncharacterized protein LOC132556509 n=1 Tax=Ylistrum balloti TaxID=509963 RepID=UPI002905AB78|nr:uncharacterized protein LOC132556509 [Ylistrum balloti]